MAGSRDDAELAARALAGSGDATEEIAARYWPRFYRVALGVLSSPADAEDAAQDALIRLLGRLSRFDASRGSFSSWAYRLAANVAIDRARDRSRARMAPLAPGTESAVRGDPARMAAEKEMVELVLGEISRLPEQQRAVITLRDGEGLDTAEVADILDSTPGNVRAQLHHARKRVAERLATEGRA